MRFISIVFMLASLNIFSCRTVNGTEKTNLENTTTITGSVRVFGNEPHTYVGIVDEAGVQYSVYPPEKEAELSKLQGRLINFTVILLAQPQGLGGLFLKGGTVTPVSWEVIEQP